jgi:K+-sensing histidine kinase KdpD
MRAHLFRQPLSTEFFESLIRAEDSKNPMASHNLGLGLYIIKEIVEAHKGTIRVTSSEKRGYRIYRPTSPLFG